MKKICFAVIIIAAFMSWQPAFAQMATTWIEKGDILEKQERYTEAVKAYTEAIKREPGCADAYLKRGIAIFLGKKTNCVESLGDLTEAIKLAPRNADAYFQRGLVNYYMINNEQARKDMETAAALGHMGAQQWIASKTETKQANLDNQISPKMKPAIYFDHDKSNIKPSYHELLKETGTVLIKKRSRASIVLSGHADSTGTEKYNDALSLKRANAVKEYLVKNFNISPGKITVKAYGESMPIASNETKEERSLNRRVEIDVYD